MATDYSKVYEKIYKAYLVFVKEHGRNPTRKELEKITGRAQAAIRTARDLYGFELFNKPGKFASPFATEARKKRTTTIRGQSITEPVTLKEGLAGKQKVTGVRFPNKTIEAAFIKDVSERFKYPFNSLEGGGKFLTNEQIWKKYYSGPYKKGNKLDDHLKWVADKEKLKYPKQTYEGERLKANLLKKRRNKAIDITSSRSMEAKIKALKAGEEGIDLAHRASLYELKRLGEQYKLSGLGIDPKLINQELIRPLEDNLAKVYDKRYKLVKNLKPGNVPKDIQLQLEAFNKQVSDLSLKSKGRIQGIFVDEKTLKPSIFGREPALEVGMGTIKDKPVKKLTQMDLVKAELNMPEQVNAQKKLIDIFNKSSNPDKVQTAIRLGCLAAAEGGRIGYALGSGTINCVNTKLTNDPVQSSLKLRAAEGIGKVRGAATNFLKLLGRGGVRAAPYAALAAVGAAAEPLVKQFVADDPNTYLTNENQMKGMLIATLEGEPPKVDEEILKWQTPALAGATAAGAIPGAAEVYRTRQGIPPNKFVGPMQKGVGPLRAGLGIKGVLGKALGASFSPLTVAATLPISVAAQRAGGTDYSDIATDPMNWMGPAFASTGAEMASKGIKSPVLLKALRMGMSPRTLSLVSRRFGLPGLAISAGMWGYDKWKNRDEE
jgi:hypothetical protein